MDRIRRGRFFNRQYDGRGQNTPEGHVLRSTRERLEYEGFTVYWGWDNVPVNLMSASKAKRLKQWVTADPVAYVEDAYHHITALYEVAL